MVKESIDSEVGEITLDLNILSLSHKHMNIYVCVYPLIPLLFTRPIVYAYTTSFITMIKSYLAIHAVTLKLLQFVACIHG